jgi:putative ubiquitin-RnfH superfamily antitoxin RatB of RatAB toxin-antitoxin module
MDNAEMKYIIVNDCGFEAAIIFDITMNHSDISVGHKVVSAGMLNVYLDYKTKQMKVGCYGQSTTLKMKSRNEDSALIQKRLIYIP